MIFVQLALYGFLKFVESFGRSGFGLFLRAENKGQQDGQQSEQRDEKARTMSAHEAPFIGEVRLVQQILAGKFPTTNVLMLERRKRLNGIDARAGLAYDALGGTFGGCDTDVGLLT